MSDLSGIQQAVQKIAEQTVQDQGKSAALDKGTASTEDVQKLQDALKQNQQPPQASAPDSAQQAQGVEKVGNVQQATNENPGAKILNHLQGMRTGQESIVSQVMNLSPNAGPAEMMKLQMAMQQMQMSHEMTSKAVSTVTKDVNELKNGQ